LIQRALPYRQIRVFYEHVVNLILDDLVETIGPMWMEVRGDFTPRGGMTTCVSAFYEKED
jgi:7-cyano-7-deazaguanine reductase